MKNNKKQSKFFASISRVIKLIFKEHPFAVIISLLFAVNTNICVYQYHCCENKKCKP